MSEIYNYTKHEFKDRDGDTPGTKLNRQLFTEMEQGISNAFSTLSSHNQRIADVAEDVAVLEKTMITSTNFIIPTKVSELENDKNYVSSDANGNVNVTKLFQGTSSPDSTIANMNRFQTDLYIQGDGSAPNNPRIAGFYMGKSATDENRHMDIVSGGEYSYIDFNKANREVDYDVRLIAKVEDGLTEMQWGNSAELTDKRFVIKGALDVASNLKVSGSIIQGEVGLLTLNGGNMTGAGPIRYPIDHQGNGDSKSTHYISAGAGYTANSGNYGVKLVCCDQSDCQSGLGQDLSSRSGGYDLSVVTGASPTGHCTLSFVSHPVNSKTYTTLGYFTETGNLYTTGSVYEGGTALSSKYAGLGTATQSAKGLMSAADKKKLDSMGTSGVNVDAIYPVGSIYMSVNSTNPATLFGGTWERLKDRFLLAAGDSYSNGATGGSADAIVVSHTHTFTGTQGSTSSDGSHSHNITHDADWPNNVSGVSSGAIMRTSSSEEGTRSFSFNTGSGGSHYHTYTPSGTISPTGESGTGKNMPPYLAVYMWKRTA